VEREIREGGLFAMSVKITERPSRRSFTVATGAPY
jgi:hypothetical protein